MRRPTSKKRRRHSQHLVASGIERLEERRLLASDAANVFATFDGTIAQANGTDRIGIDLGKTNFNLANGKVVLGFELEASSGSLLDPQAIQIQDSHGNTVSPTYTNATLANHTQSLTVAQLPLGAYTLVAGAQQGTSGAFHLAVFLAGDANGSRGVDAADLQVYKSIYGSKAGDGKYLVAADSNLDGQITSFDLAQTLANQNDSTNLNPLALGMTLSPAPISLASGALVTATAAATVTGTTEPGATVLLGLNSGGQFNNGTTIANSSGNYSFTVTLSPGANTIQTEATDSFGQQRVASTHVVLDTTPPTVTINSPAAGLITNANVSVTGVVADDLSGVASLSADVDHGTAAAVSFDGSGHFSFSTSLALDGTKDGPHTVYLVAQDYSGNTSTTPYAFTLKTTLPAQPVFALDPSYEASGNDLQTNDSTVSLDGNTDPGINVVLVGTGLSTTSDGSGKFQFANVALQAGANVFTARATDAAGNQSSYTQTITLLTTSSGPVVSAALSDDTAPGGTTNHDGITSDPSVSGTAIVAGKLAGVIAKLEAGFDDTPSGAFVSILADLQSNGTFSLDRAEIARIDGGQALSDGTHTLHLIATDQVSRVSPEYDVTFTLDDQSPTLVLAGLADGTITNKNPAVTGTVTDNLSGVQALTAQVNGGTAVALSFNGTTGAFNFTTALKTDGTADGRTYDRTPGERRRGKRRVGHARLHLEDDPARPADLRAGRRRPGERRPSEHDQQPGDADRADRAQRQPRDRPDRRDGPVDEHRRLPVPRRAAWRWATTRSRSWRRTRRGTPASTRRRSTATRRPAAWTR